MSASGGTRNVLQLTLSAAIVVLLSASACARPHPAQYQPRRWELRGAVVAVTDTGLEVRHKTGRVISLRLDEHTAYQHHHAASTREALHRGVRVAVDVESSNQGYRALTIQVF